MWMREDYKSRLAVVGLSTLFGLTVWVFDTAMDYFVFYSGEKFWKLMILRVPAHETYIRLFILACFIIFGIIVSGMMQKRNRAQREVWISELRFRGLFDNMGNGVAVYEAIDEGNNFIIKDMNKAWERIIRVNKKAIVGENILKVFSGVKEFGLFDVFQSVWRTGKPERVPLSSYQDERLSLWVDTYIYKLPSGEITAVFEDVTERKRAQDELARYQAHLEELVERRTSELVEINKELEAFSYSVSHDLRSPLRSIDGFSLALLEDYPDKLDEEGKDYLMCLRRASQTMGQLIDDLLKLSRITRSEMHREEVDLSKLAIEISTQLQQEQPERKIEWRIDSGIKAHGDARLLRVVLENLLNNAWKFTKKNSLALIEFSIAQRDQTTVIFIRDNGVGFNMAYADKLFKAFQRLHSSHEFGGTGIGLATVQRIINRHGGIIWAEAVVNKGATFYFTILRKGEIDGK